MLWVHVMCWELIEGEVKGSELRCCGALGGMNLQAGIRARWDNGSFVNQEHSPLNLLLSKGNSPWQRGWVNRPVSASAF